LKDRWTRVLTANPQTKYYHFLIMKQIPQPIHSADRIQSLDVLRGFAILGILIMNIQSYSMPGAAYNNPMAFGDMAGLNKWVWILSHIFADMKFMAIFSILYGAGVVLVTQNAEKKTGKSAGLHYRRTFWLLVIGLIHAHLIWYGDILVPYALCAFFIYFFRNVRPSRLLITGILLISVHSLIYLLFGFSLPYWPEESVAGIRETWIPEIAVINAEIQAFTGTLGEQIAHNSGRALMLETVVFFLLFLWRAGGLMLVGMAFFKWGILSAEKSKTFYTRGWIISWAIGLPIVIYGVFKNFSENFAYDYSMFIGSQFNYWGSLFVAFGYICLIMLLTKSNLWAGLKARLAAIGQMALTNYISQSVIAIFIFYGVGFSLYGEVDRTGQILITLGIWVVQFLWSKPWLSNYRFGPLEWLWRSLTYMQRQPFRKSSNN
jgi:uncharacterized protein